jgi:hypothetical protein
MSFDALAWAGKCKPGTAPRKLVLLALADRHNTEENASRPSTAWIADWTGLNRKTVIAALDELERSNLISDTGRRSGETGQIKVYSLHLESVPKTEQFQKRNSSTFSSKESQKRDTDTIREPVASEAKASSARPARKRDEFPAPPNVPEEVWRDFLNSPKRRKAGMSATAYAGITNNLVVLAEHGFPPGEMIALAVERGWTTVKMEWVLNERTRRNERFDTNPTGTALARVQAAIRSGDPFN